ncbi:hypothetical protein AAHE18_14G088700 [Arachis hypogaea]
MKKCVQTNYVREKLRRHHKMTYAPSLLGKLMGYSMRPQVFGSGETCLMLGRFGSSLKMFPRTAICSSHHHGKHIKFRRKSCTIIKCTVYKMPCGLRTIRRMLRSRLGTDSMLVQTSRA